MTDETPTNEQTVAFGGQLKRLTLEATVIRADGTREELGIIADSGDLTLASPPAE